MRGLMREMRPDDWQLRVSQQLPVDFSRKQLKTITPRSLDELYRRLGQKKGRSASTVHHFHRLLRAAFRPAQATQAVRFEPLTLFTR